MDINNVSIANSAMSPEEREAYIQAQQLSTLSAVPVMLRVAIELGVFNVLADVGPGTHLSAEEIVAKLEIERSHPNTPAMLDRILALLTSHEILSCTLGTIDHQDGTCMTIKRYGARPVCRYLIKNDDHVLMPTYMQDKIIIECWYHIKDAVLNGDLAFKRAHGMTLFEYLGQDSRFNKLFNATLSTVSVNHMRRFLPSYAGFEGVKTLVNVGGGNGVTLGMIISEHPSIKGINFDLPHVIADAPALEGVEHVSGDMFERIPNGDVMLLKLILHGFADEPSIKILKKCWEALPKNGKVIVIDGVLPKPDSTIATKFMLQMDMLMMAITLGGRERTEREFELLGRAAGFSDFKIACNLDDVYVLEFIK